MKHEQPRDLAIARRIVIRVLEAVGSARQGGDPLCRTCCGELSVPTGEGFHRRCDCADRVDEAFDRLDEAGELERLTCPWRYTDAG